VEDILLSADQETQSLYEELNVKTEEMHLGLQAVMTSLHMQTMNLREELTYKQ
jgi:hypothetical protein